MIGAVGTRRFPAFARSELADGGGRARVQRPIRFMRRFSGRGCGCWVGQERAIQKDRLLEGN